MTHATCLLALPEFEIADVWDFADEAIVHIATGHACHRGRKHDLLYRIRRTLLAGTERLDEDAIDRIRAALAVG